MKPLIFLYMIAFALSANASYFQDRCTSANGKVRINSGHSENSVVVKVVPDTGLPEKEFRFNFSDVNITDLEEEKVIEDERHGCKDGLGDVQIVTFRSTSIRKVELSLASNLESRKPFEKIKTILLCERFMHGEALCCY